MEAVKAPAPSFKDSNNALLPVPRVVVWIILVLLSEGAKQSRAREMLVALEDAGTFEAVVERWWMGSDDRRSLHCQRAPVL